jgi:hypothetical protein
LTRVRIISLVHFLALLNALSIVELLQKFMRVAMRQFNAAAELNGDRHRLVTAVRAMLASPDQSLDITDFFSLVGLKSRLLQAQPGQTFFYYAAGTVKFYAPYIQLFAETEKEFKFAGALRFANK